MSQENSASPAALAGGSAEGPSDRAAAAVTPTAMSAGDVPAPPDPAVPETPPVVAAMAPVAVGVGDAPTALDAAERHVEGGDAPPGPPTAGGAAAGHVEGGDPPRDPPAADGTAGAAASLDLPPLPWLDSAPSGFQAAPEGDGPSAAEAAWPALGAPGGRATPSSEGNPVDGGALGSVRDGDARGPVHAGGVVLAGDTGESSTPKAGWNPPPGLPDTYQYRPSQYQPSGAVTPAPAGEGQLPVVAAPSPRSKMAAGLLAIFLGPLGIHNFYLGFNKRGLIQLLITVLTLGIGSIVTWIWGLVEGISILTAEPGSPRSVDAQGVPLTA